MEEDIEKFVKSKDGIIYLTDWNKYHPTPCQSTLRSYVFHRKTNGFLKVMKRTDRRIKLDEREYYKWMIERGEIYEMKMK